MEEKAEFPKEYSLVKFIENLIELKLFIHIIHKIWKLVFQEAPQLKLVILFRKTKLNLELSLLVE